MENLFQPKLITYSALKRLMPGWIDKAWEDMRTPEMKAAIVKSFQNDGQCFGVMRDPAYITSLREEDDI